MSYKRSWAGYYEQPFSEVAENIPLITGLASYNDTLPHLNPRRPIQSYGQRHPSRDPVGDSANNNNKAKVL